MKPDCQGVRDVLWPLDRPRSHEPEEEVAREHLSTCDDCRSFFLRDAELTRLLRRVGEGLDVAAPHHLRAAVAQSLARHPAQTEVAVGPATDTGIAIHSAAGPPRGRAAGRRSEIVAAAAAVILLAGGLILSDRFGDRGDPDRFAADYARTAMVQIGQPGLDTGAIEEFYETALGRRIVPVALHDAPVTRATVCDLAGDLGSMIEYDLAGTRLVHYRIPLDARSEVERRTTVAVDTRRGVQVAHWVDDGFENALVADAPADYVRWLAEERFFGPIEVRNYGSPASRSWRLVAN